MSDRHRILHIFGPDSSASDSARRVLADIDASIDHTDNCYVGLGHLARHGVENYCAVLVELKALTHSDDEFLQLVSRRFRQVPIYTYGAELGQLNAQWATLSGARGHVAIGELPEMLARLPARPPAAVAEPTVEGPTSRLTDILVNQIIQPRDASELAAVGQANDPQADDPQGEDFSADHIARRRRQARSKRHEPQTGGAADQAAADQAVGEALLSKEELDALLGEGRSAAGEKLKKKQREEH